MAALISSLPARTKILNDTSDVLFKILSRERQAFGKGAEAATTDLPTIYIKDLTGRHDPDAPPGLRNDVRAVTRTAEDARAVLQPRDHASR